MTYILRTSDGLGAGIRITWLAIEQTILANTIWIVRRDVDHRSPGNDRGAIGKVQVLHHVTRTDFDLL